MQFAAICDACRVALVDRATSVQVMPGAIVASPSGPTLRSTGSPEAYFLCDRCTQHVTQTLHALTAQGQALRAQAN
ncbi:MAG: hypothetical protein V3R95_02215 [Dehalococcoidia bacterium]